MVDRVAGGKGLPGEVLERIVARTDGVPLFLEELTRAVLESGLLRDEGERYALSGPVPALAVPATLYDSLLARLDRLAPVKEVAQIGAVIGREFSHALLEAVAPLPEGALRDALDRLVEAELVFRRGSPPGATYTFKHALVQDAAYGTLLRSKRQQLHARIAQALEGQFPETAGTEPELLAHHCAEAGLAKKAADYWLKAGQLALSRSAMAEAVAQLSKGLEVLKSLSDDPARWRRELELQVALGQALIAARGFAAPETGRAYARARELCEQLGDTPQLFPAVYGNFVFHFQRAELAAAHAVAEELLHLAQERGDAAAEVTGHRIVGSALFHLGRLVEARTQLEEGLARYDPARDRTSGLVYAVDSRVICLHWLSHALLALGYPEQARARAGVALAHARELAHPNTVAQALYCSCTLSELLRRGRDAQAQAEALTALATEQGSPFWLAMGTILRGRARAEAEQAEAGVAELRQGLTALQATGSELFVSYALAFLAEAHGKGGQAAEGLSLVTEALARVGKTGERWFEAELHRLKGEVLLMQDGRNAASKAASCFLKAIDIARSQEAKSWELRAATSLARLWAHQGKRVHAGDRLAPIYGWFTEGFHTADLKDAKALLDELA